MGVAAVIALLMVVVRGFRRVSEWIKVRAEHLLGDYFEYASIFSVLTLAVVALAAVTYFFVPLEIWLAGVTAVVGLTTLLVVTS